MPLVTDILPTEDEGAIETEAELVVCVEVSEDPFTFDDSIVDERAAVPKVCNGVVEAAIRFDDSVRAELILDIPVVGSDVERAEVLTLEVNNVTEVSIGELDSPLEVVVLLGNDTVEEPGVVNVIPMLTVLFAANEVVVEVELRPVLSVALVVLDSARESVVETGTVVVLLLGGVEGEEETAVVVLITLHIALFIPAPSSPAFSNVLTSKV